MSPRRDWLESLPYLRRKAAKAIRCGWTREQAIGRTSEYGCTRTLHKASYRPLTRLVAVERRIRVDQEAVRDARAAIDNHRFVMGMFDQILGRAA